VTQARTTPETATDGAANSSSPSRPPPVEEADLTAGRKPHPGRRLTWEEFLEWYDDEFAAEWVDGEVILVMPNSVPHMRIVGFLFTLLNLYATVHDLGSVFTERLLMRLPSRPSGREPDILFIAKERLNRLQHTYLDGPADLVVEVISPDSRWRDTVDKFGEYATAGVGEYWQIHPDEHWARFYHLGLNGQYAEVAPDDQSVYRSAALPGFWLRVDWLWQVPPPQIEALNALGLLRPA